MLNETEIKNIAIRTIEEEAKAVANLKAYINNDFAKCVELILSCTGRIIITGIGKSANIGAKFVATLNSTGTPAVFMHAADAIHGDLGIIKNEDVIICISKSGNTPEIKVLVPLLKNLGSKLIAMVGNLDSYLALQADYILNTTVDKEACPNNLAPTSSTTAQLVMGDAISVCVFECRGFSAKDFARYHPGGSLGKQLYLKVNDVFARNERPQVIAETSVKDVIIEISSKRLGATAVVESNKIVGIVTDGDIRRMLQNNSSFDKLTAKDIMCKTPKTIDINTLAVDALDLMRQKNITQLLVTKNGEYAGIIHLHDILNEGII